MILLNLIIYQFWDNIRLQRLKYTGLYILIVKLPKSYNCDKKTIEIQETINSLQEKEDNKSESKKLHIELLSKWWSNCYIKNNES